jgi:hypothetical protein
MDRWLMIGTRFYMMSFSTRTGSNWFQNLKGNILKVCHDSPTTGN